MSGRGGFYSIANDALGEAADGAAGAAQSNAIGASVDAVYSGPGFIVLSPQQRRAAAEASATGFIGTIFRRIPGVGDWAASCLEEAAAQGTSHVVIPQEAYNIRLAFERGEITREAYEALYPMALDYAAAIDDLPTLMDNFSVSGVIIGVAGANEDISRQFIRQAVRIRLPSEYLPEELRSDYALEQRAQRLPQYWTDLRSAGASMMQAGGWEHVDTNRDGQIDEHEIIDAAKNLGIHQRYGLHDPAVFDTSSDGRITPREVTDRLNTAITQRTPAYNRQLAGLTDDLAQRPGWLNALDRDGNGQIEIEHLHVFMQTIGIREYQLDADGNGEIEIGELTGGLNEAAERWQQARDRDGRS